MSRKRASGIAGHYWRERASDSSEPARGSLLPANSRRPIGGYEAPEHMPVRGWWRVGVGVYEAYFATIGDAKSEVEAGVLRSGAA